MLKLAFYKFLPKCTFTFMDLTAEPLRIKYLVSQEYCHKFTHHQPFDRQRLVKFYYFYIISL
jgi:hypothetical protein